MVSDASPVVNNDFLHVACKSHPLLQYFKDENRFFLFQLTPDHGRSDRLWAKKPIYRGPKLATGMVSAAEIEAQWSSVTPAALPAFTPGTGDFFYDLGRHTDPASDELTVAAAHQIAVYKSQLSAGFTLGYYISAESKRFLYDLDGCRNPETGELTEKARDAVELFGGSGAYIEVSPSGTGLHVIGRYTGERPIHSTANDEFDLELYTDGRQMAIGTPYAGTGSPDADCTALLDMYLIPSYFPKSAPRAPLVPGDVAPLTPDQKRHGLNIMKQTVSRKYPDNYSGFWNNGLRNLSKYVGHMVGAEVLSAEEAEEFIRGIEWVAIYQQQKPGDVERLISTGFEKGSMEPWDYSEVEEFQLERAAFGDGSLPAGASLEPVVDAAARRRAQIEENIRIGNGSDEHMPSEVLTLEEMQSRFVYITEMESVQDLKYPRNILPFTAFMKDHSGSKTERVIESEWGPGGKPKKKVYPTAALWMDGGERRKKALTVTFRPGAPILTVDPDGKLAANTWRPIERKPSTSSCELFLSHVEYLFGAEAPRFLDFLAHIEQEPGTLPHSGWVHISPSQGTGRNWLSSVLSKLWQGLVAPSFDLSGTLNSGFNGNLSHRLLAVVDEIDEGGGDAKWSNAEALKSLVTAATRSINPKFGRQRLEHNTCRWLIFSNHTSALPLTKEDRRFNVVRNDAPPMPGSYYAALYAALKDREFIDAVAWLLKTRDIRGFNPGAHAAMTDAKREMIGASKSEADDIVDELLATYAQDVITSGALVSRLNNGQALKAHHKHALERAGVRAYGKTIKHGGKVVRVSVLRNWDRWKDASLESVHFELQKAIPSFSNLAVISGN